MMNKVVSGLSSTTLLLACIALHTSGSGEPIKKSNFRHVRWPVFALKPTCVRQSRNEDQRDSNEGQL